MNPPFNLRTSVLNNAKGTPMQFSLAALGPLKLPVFRMLWMTWFVANSCAWMNDVATAWLMSSLTTSPVWVALVQSASTLPVFLLGLPCGALADILDRRRYFVFTQFWVAATAILLCLAVVSDFMSPPVLLGLTFINGIGLAMRWPVFAAIAPDLVPRDELPAALALNGISMNASRIIGPLIAGAIIASAGIASVFALNAALSIISGFVILRWRHKHVVSYLGREKLSSAMRVGLQYVTQSRRIQSVLLRVFVFYWHVMAFMALLPLIARRMPDGGAGAYTLLLAAIGAGAICTAVVLTRLRQALSRDAIVLSGTALQSAATALLAFTDNLPLALLATFIAGVGWIAAANTLTLSVQLALPNWVRARGMSIYLIAFMGASAMGAAFWGQVAAKTSVSICLAIASISGIVLMFAAHHLILDRSMEEDLTPSDLLKPPRIEAPPESGQVTVTIEYLIDPSRTTEFLQVMEESRRSRLRQGALSCELGQDVTNPARYVERIVEASWTEHLRRFERVTAADITLREKKLAFHVLDMPPVVDRWVSKGTSAGG